MTAPRLLTAALFGKRVNWIDTDDAYEEPVAERELVTAIGDELARLFSFGERHRRLWARLVLVIVATMAVDVCGTVTFYLLERNAHGSDVRTFGQAFFFTTVQLLTVSSQIKNPVTPWGRVLDVLLELWAVIVVAGSAGAVAAFFQNGDSQA